MLCEAVVHAYNALEYRDKAVRFILGGQGQPYPCAWSDEHPRVDGTPTWPPKCHEQCEETILRLIRVRQDLWRTGEVPEADKEFWDTVWALIPRWPGFHRLEAPPVCSFDLVTPTDAFRSVRWIVERVIGGRLRLFLGKGEDDTESIDEIVAQALERAPGNPEMEAVLRRVRLLNRRQQWANDRIDATRPGDATFEDLRKFRRLASKLFSRGKRILGELDECLDAA